MSDKRYPTRMHEALGVETGEVFDYEGRTWTINESGVLSIVNKRPGCYEVVGPSAVCIMINHPERITRRPRLTEEQVAQPKWIKTADRFPTKADAGVDEEIVTIYDDGETREMGTDYWAFVAKVPERFPYWLPVPKLPEVEG